MTKEREGKISSTCPSPLSLSFVRQLHLQVASFGNLDGYLADTRCPVADASLKPVPIEIHRRP